MVETIDKSKLKEAIKILKLKYGILKQNYPSKVEVLRELEMRLEID